MKIQITHDTSLILYNNILVIDIYTFSTTASILLGKEPKRLYALAWGAEEVFILQEKLNQSEETFLLIDDSIQNRDEKKLRINGHPLPIYYYNEVFWKKYNEYSILYRSTNWTQSIHKSYKNDRNIFIWSLINFSTTIEYLKRNVAEITLLVCGSKGIPNSDDLMCAQYYEHFLSGNFDPEKKFLKKLIRAMILSQWDGDFFERYIDTPYGSLLWFNLQVDLVPWVVKISPTEIYNSEAYLISKIPYEW